MPMTQLILVFLFFSSLFLLFYDKNMVDVI